MSADEFFGTIISRREIGKYVMALREYPGGSGLASHTHGESFATIVVSGGLCERICFCCGRLRRA